MISDASRAETVMDAVQQACAEARIPAPQIGAGADAVVELAGSLGPGDVVLNAVTGSVGLLPTLAVLDSGARLALANKESLVVGGHLVTEAAAPGQILPVDSEHTAIAQALAGVEHDQIDHLVVTASGGPFRGRSREELSQVTPEQALAHPTWSMGRVITTNSATLVNKALEVIEACFQFDLPGIGSRWSSIRSRSCIRWSPWSTAPRSPRRARRTCATPSAGPSPILRSCPASPRPWISPPRSPGPSNRSTRTPSTRSLSPAPRTGKAAARMAVYNAVDEEAVEAFFTGSLSFLGIAALIREVLEDPRRPRAQRVDGVEGLLAVEDWARVTAPR